MSFRFIKDKVNDPAWLYSLLSQSPAVVFICDIGNGFQTRFITDNVKRQFGYAPEDLVGDPCFWKKNLHPKDKPHVNRNVKILLAKRNHIFDYRLRHANGEYRWVREESIVVADENDNPAEIIGYWSDITHHKTLETMATLDPLTGALNRRYFLQTIEKEWEMIKRRKSVLSLLMLDIDHFKSINDGYGHATGDTVLKTMVNICQQKLRKTDMLARIGGDEFAILLPHIIDLEVLKIAERLRHQIHQKVFHQGDKIFHISASIGMIECFPQRESIEQSLERADKSLYEAKSRGRNRIFSHNQSCDKAASTVLHI